MAKPSRLSRLLAPDLTRVGGRLAPLGRLARRDVGLARDWLAHAGALEATLGPETAAAYTALVVDVAGRDLPLARTVARALPDELARLPAPRRRRALRLLGVVAAERVEALPLVSRALPGLLDQLDDASLATYLSRALALHRESAAKAESFLLQQSRTGIEAAAALQRGLPLAEVQRTLSLYARAHCGQDVLVVPAPPGARAFTDGRHLYLPPKIDRFGDRRDFLVYRVLTARNAGYLEFGTLDIALDALPGDWPATRPGELELERFFRGFPNRSLARDLFMIYESARVEAQVRAEYPGVARDMDALADAWRPERAPPSGRGPAELAVDVLARTALGLALLPAAAHPEGDAARAVGLGAAAALAALRTPGAAVDDTARAVLAAYPDFDGLLRRVDDADLSRVPPPAPGGGGGAPPREAGAAPGDGAPETPPEPETGEPAAPEASTSAAPAPYTPMDEGDALGPALRLDRMSAEERALEARARSLLDALKSADDAEAADLRAARARARAERESYEQMAAMLDRMDAPGGPVQGQAEDAGRAAPPGPAEGAAAAPLSADATDTGVTALYPEWDATIGDHKPDWVRVREYRLAPGDHAFVDQVRAEHGALVARIRRSFEALRPAGLRRERGLLDGDELDIDRAIQERIQLRAGSSADGRIYARRRPRERDVAVAFLVDMSSSTNEVVDGQGKRVIDVAKEALVLTAEAVDAVGDACAIWGFSGYGRDQVAFYVAKEPGDPWDDTVRERVGRISWKMENRDGAAIRHAVAKMEGWRQRVKLLILLSDGRPLDCGCDHYADRYAQDDTRAALNEARAAGVHPFCITVDPQGQRYLERMYGTGAYTVIDRVELLPQRLQTVYRRLTR